MSRTIALEMSDARSLFLADGEIWVSGGEAVVLVDSSTGVTLRRFPTLEGGELIGELAGRPILSAASGLVSIDTATDSVHLGRAAEERDAITVDPLGRFIYISGASGAITAYDPVTLVPLWGWGAVGGRSEGITVALEGHRFYEAVTPEEGQPHLLVRDLQTGRVLQELELGEAVRRLETSASGSLYALQGDAEDGEVVGYGWSDGALAREWRRPLPGVEATASTRLRVAPNGRVIAVLTPGNEEGLHIIDAETGALIARANGPARDVIFGSGGRVFLLLADEIRQLELDQ